MSQYGSPPRMRERQEARYIIDQEGRITPAYAGKTSSILLGAKEGKDHPRVCGKDLFRCVHIAPNIGSPPRMRERPNSYCWVLADKRITPAYAGKTGYDGECWLPIGDHPRVCGKDTRGTAVHSGIEGSPPRMRERRSHERKKHFQYGITPAYAGKTISNSFAWSDGEDHPRVCGKDYTIPKRMGSIPGSPPRMRERLEFHTAALLQVGITPAYAGKTSICGKFNVWKQDHPRVCGKDATKKEHLKP